jgi:hypothetical protein
MRLIRAASSQAMAASRFSRRSHSVGRLSSEIRSNQRRTSSTAPGAEKISAGLYAAGSVMLTRFAGPGNAGPVAHGSSRECHRSWPFGTEPIDDGPAHVAKTIGGTESVTDLATMAAGNGIQKLM